MFAFLQLIVMTIIRSATQTKKSAQPFSSIKLPDSFSFRFVYFLQQKRQEKLTVFKQKLRMDS